jgi:uncharacterized protein YndB with AHSA1/START domain
MRQESSYGKWAIFCGGGIVLNFGVTIDVSKRRLWEAITQPDQRAQWWAPNLVLEARLGGRFRDAWHDGVELQITEGAVEEFFPTDLLGLTWRESAWPPAAQSKVSLVLEANGLKSRLEVRHEPLSGFAQGEWENVRKSFFVAWPELLFSLRSFLHRCDAQSAHDLVLRAKLSVPVKDAIPALLEHGYFSHSEVLLREGDARAVLAWKACGPHSVLETRGGTLVEMNAVSDGRQGSSVRVVHTGFGFSPEWIEAREWQDMAWSRFFDMLKDDL